MNAKQNKTESKLDQDLRSTELPWPLSTQMLEDSKYQLLPALSPAEYEALKKDIDENGLDDPVVFDEHGNVLDGHNRLRACLELAKTDFPCKIKRGLQSEQDKKNWVRGRNCRRRHLTHEQKRNLCVAQLKETPELSDTNIGRIVAVDHKTVGKYRRELEDLGTITVVEERKSKNGAVRKSPKRQPAAPKPTPTPKAVEQTAPVAVTASDNELPDDVPDVPVGEPDVTELAHDECLLLAGSLLDLRRHLEPQYLRGIICDNPLKPGRGRKPRKPVVPPETLQHYKDVAKLAAQTLEPDGVLAVPVENWALEQAIAAIAPHVPYWLTMAQVPPDAQVTAERYSLECKYVLLFSGGSPGSILAGSDTQDVSDVCGPWKSDCELHIMLAADGEPVLHIDPTSQTVGELLHWGHPVTAVYGAGSDLADKWLQIGRATEEAKDVHGEFDPAAEDATED